jgi:glycosyltransferase involved in cell wall biosynthesis
LKSSDSIVALSQFTKNKLKWTYQIPDSRISVIPGGIDTKRFRPDSDKKESREKLGLPPNKTLLFTVRNLVQRMGLEVLIRALGPVIAEAPDIHLIIGGEGPLEHTLKDLVQRLHLQQSVTFTGFIAEDDLPDYFRAADLFILPTQELEGFGLVTLEAMASGIPVLGTPVGGTREILGRFNPEFLFKDTTAETMENLIIQTYIRMNENPKWWPEMSRSCRRFVEDNYSWERNVDALEALFFELGADRRH